MKELGTQLLVWANQGVDLLTTELPVFVEQLLLWKTASYTVAVFVCLTLCIYARKLYKKGMTRAFEVTKENPNTFGYGLGEDYILLTNFWGAGLAGAFGWIGLIKYVKELIQITLAPRIWLLEYAADLLNK